MVNWKRIWVVVFHLLVFVVHHVTENRLQILYYNTIGEAIHTSQMVVQHGFRSARGFIGTL